jgi:hypothetical protein
MVAASASLSELSEQLRGVLRGFETGRRVREGRAEEAG